MGAGFWVSGCDFRVLNSGCGVQGCFWICTLTCCVHSNDMQNVLSMPVRAALHVHNSWSQNTDMFHDVLETLSRTKNIFQFCAFTSHRIFGMPGCPGMILFLFWSKRVKTRSPSVCWKLPNEQPPHALSFTPKKGPWTDWAVPRV